MIAFYPQDWVLLHVGTPEWSSAPIDGGVRHTIEVPAPRLCPRSLYEGRHNDFFNGRDRFNEWLRTDKIPADCPELKRVVSISGVSP